MVSADWPLFLAQSVIFSRHSGPSPAEPESIAFALMPSFPRKRENILILRREVQSIVSPAASHLLFGIAQKVGKKARHRTRWSDSHRANRTALCFSLAPALATVRPCTALGDRDPSRSLSEYSRHELRCS